MNTAKVKFDFFSVRTAEGNTISFEAALNELLAMPPEESSIKIDNTDCSVCDSLRQKEYYAFLFSKIRMDRLIYWGDVRIEDRYIDINHLQRLACEALRQNYEELRNYVTQNT